jgi:pSer/pThr/pTyr-binding forkhead associated (FHA) protein
MIQVRPDPNGYDDRHYLSLKGTGLDGDGQLLKLNLGESVFCGRSRHCQWSLKRTPGFLQAAKDERDRRRKGDTWRTVSRRHCRVTYVSPDMVEVENLSPNGTLVDGHSVDRIVLTDCRRKSHRIQLGPHGVTLDLEPGALPI